MVARNANLLRANGMVNLNRRGAAHHQSKLRERDVFKIRRLYDAKAPLGDIAGQFKISRGYAVEVGRRRAWAWLPEKKTK